MVSLLRILEIALGVAIGLSLYDLLSAAWFAPGRDSGRKGAANGEPAGFADESEPDSPEEEDADEKRRKETARRSFY